MRTLSPDQIQIAADLLKQGELVAFPTETVYGLGAPIFNPQAIAKIFQVKGRPAKNPLIAHISHLAQVEQIAREIPSDFDRLASQFFPGPLTIVLKKHPQVPSLVSGGLETIAFRMPSHPIAQALIEAVKEPLVAPSANLSGKPSSTTAAHVRSDFEGKIAAVIEGGETPLGIESTVISLISSTPCLLRPGTIPAEALEEALGKSLQTPSQVNLAASPGTHYRHYAPEAKILIFTNRQEFEHYLPLAQGFVLSTEKESQSRYLKPSNLYALLREADQEGASEIVIFCDESAMKDAAFMDRLSRASNHNALI